MLAVRVLIAASTVAIAWGLDPQLAITQYGHDVWTTAKGLTHDSVRSIAQTPDGYLWIATMGGVARFDGENFTLLSAIVPGIDPKLQADRPAVMAAGKDGTLWIGTTGSGVLQLREGKVSQIPGTLPNRNVRALWVDAKGVLWIGSERGLSQYDGRKLTTMYQGGTEWYVHTLFEWPAGTMWAGTNGGLRRIAEGTLTTYTMKDGLAGDPVWAVAAGEGNDLWVGTRPGGLSMLHDGRFTNYTKRDGLTQNTVIALSRDRNGTLWIGTDGGGLNRFYRGRFSSYQTREGLSNQVIRCLYEDQEGSLWLGTAGGGVNRLKESRFAIRSTREDLPSDVVHSVFQDSQDEIWVGTANGIGRIPPDGGSLTRYGVEDGLARDLAWPVVRDRRGGLWVGGENGRVQYFRGGDIRNPGARRSWKFPGGIRAVFAQRDGTVWAGSTEVLVRFQNGRPRIVGSADGLAPGLVRAVVETTDGHLWFALDHVIQEYRDGRFQAPIVISSTHITTDMFEDRAHALWILHSDGLTRIQDGHTVVYDSANGLPERDLFQVVEDDIGSFWIASRNGLLRIPKSELEAAAGTHRRLKFDRFGPADGLEGGSDFSFAYFPSHCKLRDGRIWFPTSGGLLIVNPATIKTNLRPPPVFVERIAAGNRFSISQADKVYAGSNIEFHYTALSYLFPERVRFRYLLKGFDPDWVDAGNRRVAYYTNLPPGSYHFLVMACNNDGIWNRAGASMALVLIPHFYQTIWFMVLCAALVWGTGMMVYWWRVREHWRRERLLTERVEARTAALSLEVQERRKAEEAARIASTCKSQFLAHMSHEIRTPMNGIIGMTDLALDAQTPEECRDYLSTVKMSAQSLLAIINDILDFSKVEAGKMVLDVGPLELSETLAEAMKTMTVSAQKKGLSLTWAVGAGVPSRVLGDSLRLRQIVINLTSNAIKFTQQGSVHLAVGVDPSRDEREVTLHFQVRDTGIGISADEQSRLFQPFEQADRSTTRKYGGTGLGLAISAHLVELMGGRIWIESTPGKGSVFHFTARCQVSEPIPTSELPAAPANREHDDCPKRILIAEDNVVNQKIAILVVEKMGHRVTIASNGSEAVQKWRTGSYDLILMDLQMPELDGLEATRLIRAEEAATGSHTPIVAMTAHAMDSDREQCLAAGMDDYISKPISRDSLQRAIQHAGTLAGGGVIHGFDGV
jgi:signal transduction histidine kinase/ligand-binding sensor domain-containing protein/CheY-like chemotaxis protein